MIVLADLVADGLRVERFIAKPGEAWCLFGAIGSGVERFFDIISGEKGAFRADTLQLPADIGILSFKHQQALFEAEIYKDDTDYLGRIDPGTPARAFLTDIEQHRALLDRFGLTHLLNRGYRQLSSGQARKLCLLQHLTRGVQTLILENPYEGLDRAACQDLDQVLAGLHAQGMTLLIVIGNSCDIPAWITHLAAFQGGSLVMQGLRDAILPKIVGLLHQHSSFLQVSVEVLRREGQVFAHQPVGSPIMSLRNGFARYGDIDVFTGLNLTINCGDHTLITGPNGCGKSSLLHLITGDHPLCYQNDLTIFGRRRGSGESIWEIKQQMGIVSPELHRNHRISGSALAIVVSGLFDSIGLYRQPTQEQQELALRWLARLGLSARATVPFRRLSFGEQRLILLGRALIKAPPLLVLDEPTCGLDEGHRLALLDLLGRIAKEQLATILYVSHRPDEYRDFFKQQVQFS